MSFKRNYRGISVDDTCRHCHRFAEKVRVIDKTEYLVGIRFFLVLFGKLVAVLL